MLFQEIGQSHTHFNIVTELAVDCMQLQCARNNVDVISIATNYIQV